MKKIYNRVIIGLILLLSTITAKHVTAQEIDTNALINAYYASELIFEGVVEEICYYEDPSTGIIYTSNKINISKIFKGNMQCGTINIITPGGQLNGYEVHVSHQTEFNAGVTGVFMCKSTLYPQPSCNTATNEKAVELTVAFQGTLEYLFDNINQEVEGFNSYFNTIEDFYAFLQNNGITITNCNNSIIANARSRAQVRNIIVDEPVKINDPKSLTAIEVQKLESTVNFLKHNINTNLGKAGENLEFTISNVNFINSGTSITVDINVKSNVNTTFLGSCAFRLKYNKNTFGGNIGNNLTATYGSAFSNPASYNNIFASDYKDSIITFYVTGQFDPPSRAQITTTPLKLMTITIPVVNCKRTPNFKIDTFALVANYTAFSTSSNAPTIPSNSYAAIILGAQNNGSICQPTVTFVSNNLRAGVGDIITIDGSNFGNVKGNISMQNADGMPSQIALDKYDVTQWNNTQIKIRVPSTVDSSDFNGTTYTKHPVGTGPITITDVYGGSISTSPVIIEYAVENRSKVYGSGYSKTNCYLLSDNTDGKYHFKLHSNITNPKMIACIYAAVRRWRCTTGLPFVIDPGTATNGIASDNVNIIKLSSIADPSILANTWTYTVSGCSNNASMPIPISEMDIEINDNQPQFKYDTTGTKSIEIDSTDFFNTFLHELGHALGLKHVLNKDMIMYPYAETTAVFANNRKIIIKNNDLLAANYIINNSLATPIGMTCSFNLPIIKQTAPCYWNNSLNDLDNSSKPLVVYPNPFSSSISIEYNSLNKEYSTLVLFDINGKKVYDNSQIATLIGKNTISLNEIDFNNGLYSIRLIVDGKIYNSKISCIR